MRAVWIAAVLLVVGPAVSAASTASVDLGPAPDIGPRRTAPAVRSAVGDVGDALQMLADLTLIDRECRGLAVNFGVGFAHAVALGLPPATAMPTGRMRRHFERDLLSSEEGYPAEITCGALATHYAIEVPGSVVFPAGPNGP